MEDWDNKSLRERKDRTIAVKAIADNIDAILNVTLDKDISDAFVAVLNLMNTLKQLNSSDGHIDSIPAMFTSSCINLFEKTIFHVDDYYAYAYHMSINLDAKNEVWDFLDVFFPDRDIWEMMMSTTRPNGLIKRLVNRAGKNNDKISQQNANKLYASIKKLYKFPLTDELQKELRLAIEDNDAHDTDFYLTCIEFYIKLEIIKQAMLTQMLSLFPQNNPKVFKITLARLRESKQTLLPLVNVLYDKTLGSKFYDSREDSGKVTNAYIAIQLGVPRPHDFPGLNCCSGKPKYWKISKVI